MNKIVNGRLESCRKSLTGDCGTDQRENSRTDDGSDADTREIERGERALHLPLSRGGFGHQMIGTLGFEKLRAHRSRSCHQAVRLVNPKLWTSISRTQGGPKFMRSRRRENLFVISRRYDG